MVLILLLLLSGQTIQTWEASNTAVFRTIKSSRKKSRLASNYLLNSFMKFCTDMPAKGVTNQLQVS
jgi:hypothetical protein